MKNYLLCVAVLLLSATHPACAHFSIPGTPQQAAAGQKFNLLHKAGLAAGAARDYADAVTDLRRAAAVWPDYPIVRAELGLMLDYQGKTDKAFVCYREAFGSPIAPKFGTDEPLLVEALARYGGMCEQRGLHTDAVQCFNLARSWAYSSQPLDMMLETTASPTLVRAMLLIVRGIALEDEEYFVADRSVEALAAFREAETLMPGDPRAHYFVTYGLSHIKRSKQVVQ